MVTARRPKTAAKEKRGMGRASAGPPARTTFSLSEEETYELGRTFGRGLKGGEILLLVGDLGLGKTVFARGIAAALGVAPEDVSSPSFTLVQEYTGGRVPMFHVDLYRIDDPEEIGTLGLEDIVSAGAVVAVEWGDKLPPFLRRNAITVRFHDVGEGSRRIEVLPGAQLQPRPTADA
jgi:tRNA threonylcarbamoyladenosine biosynthesis protein TsaE